MALGDIGVKRAFLNGETLFREDTLADGTESYTACRVVAVDLDSNWEVVSADTVSLIPNASVVEVKRAASGVPFPTLSTKTDMVAAWRMRLFME